MPIDEYKKHVDVSKWENVAILVLDRMENYDKKFDVIAKDVHMIATSVESIALTISKHDIYIKILGIPSVIIGAYLLLNLLGKVL